MLFGLVAVYAKIIFRLYDLLFLSIPHVQTNAHQSHSAHICLLVFVNLGPITHIPQSFASSEVRRSVD